MKLFIATLILFSSILFAQTYSTYYYQKATQYELLPNDENEIIFLGDSITDMGEWSELLGNPKVKNRGISGDKTSGVIDRLDEIVESNPEKIFIMIGVNDLSLNITPDSLIKNYETILNYIQNESPSTKVYVQSILPVNNKFDKFANHVSKGEEIKSSNQMLAELADELNITFINLYPHFLNEENQLDEKYTNDGLHLMGEGYILWKNLIKDYLN